MAWSWVELDNMRIGIGIDIVWHEMDIGGIVWNGHWWYYWKYGML